VAIAAAPTHTAESPALTGHADHATNQQVVNVPAKWYPKRAFIGFWRGVYRFRLRFYQSRQAHFKSSKTRVGTRCASISELTQARWTAHALPAYPHPACQLRQMWRAAVRAGSVRILRGKQRASPLEMRALRILLRDYRLLWRTAGTASVRPATTLKCDAWVMVVNARVSGGKPCAN
jgi:hypothetical protein